MLRQRDCHKRTETEIKIYAPICPEMSDISSKPSENGKRQARLGLLFSEAAWPIDTVVWDSEHKLINLF